MHVVNPEEAENRRQAYAEMLEDIAHQVRTDGRVPEALFGQILWADGGLTRYQNIEEGFQTLKALGAFEVVKANLLAEMLGVTRE